MLVVISCCCFDVFVLAASRALDDFLRSRPIFLLRAALWVPLVPLFCSASLLLLLNKEEPPRIVRLRRKTGLLSTTAEADVANGVSGAADDDANGGSPAAADDACWSINPSTEATNKNQKPSPKRARNKDTRNF